MYRHKKSSPYMAAQLRHDLNRVVEMLRHQLSNGNIATLADGALGAETRSAEGTCRLSCCGELYVNKAESRDIVA